jgi:hypothetical protein
MLTATVAPYGYANGDPVNRGDPSGLDSPYPGTPDATCDYLSRATDGVQDNLLISAINLDCVLYGQVENVPAELQNQTSPAQAVEDQGSSVLSLVETEVMSRLAEYVGPYDAVPGLDVAVATYDLFSVENSLFGAFLNEFAATFDTGPPPPPPPPPPVVSCVYG